MMEQYKSNSHKSKDAEAAKAEEKKVEKVVTGGVRKKKPSALGSFFNSKDISEIKEYLIEDILKPTAKNLIYDLVCNGANMLLGEPVRSKSKSPGSKVSYRSYGEHYNERKDYNKPRSQQAYSYTDLIFDNRADAEEVLYRMEEILDNFQAVSVSDLFDMAGVTGSYTDNKFGWTNLDDAYVERVRDGYIINLPKASTI